MLRGASAEALRRADRARSGRLGTPTDAATLGDELFGVAGVLRARAGAAPGRSPTPRSTGEAKAGLVEQRLRRPARRRRRSTCSPTPCGRRWTLSRDLRRRARAARRDRASSARPAPRPARSATSCSRSRQLVDGEPRRCATRSSDPARVGRRQGGAARRAARRQGRCPATAALVEQACRGTHRTVDRGARRATSKIAAERRRASWSPPCASPRPLADGRPAAGSPSALGQQYDRDRSTSTSSSTPSVIGGLRVEIGDDVIDGTVASRLDDARRRLAG